MNTTIIHPEPAIEQRSAYPSVKELGFTGLEIFEYDNWPEILEYLYTNRDTGKLYQLPRFKNKSAGYFKRTGHKHSLVFQNLIKSGEGKLRCLIVNAKGIDINSPDARRLLDKVLKHPKFCELTLSYNAQQGQKPDSFHIHLLAFVPDSKKMPKEFKIKIDGRFYTVENGVEAGTGKYEGQPMKIGVRRLVQYHRFPQDQRYRSWIEGARMQAYREHYEQGIERLETGIKKTAHTLKGVRNMAALIKELTMADIGTELAEFGVFQEQKQAHRAAQKARAESIPYNPHTLPEPHPLKPHPADINPTFSDTPQDITQTIVNSILNHLDPSPLIIPFNPIKTPQFNLRI